MANLKITIEEKLTLEGVDRGATTTQTISNIVNVDNRVVTIPSGSQTQVFNFHPSNLNAGTFTTSSFAYGRVTNKSSVPVKMFVSSSASSYATYELTSGSSFILSSTKFSGSLVGVGAFSYNDYISSIILEPSGSSAIVEYLIATR